MSASVHIRPAIEADAGAIAAMLARMGAELGDPCTSTEATIRAQGFGPGAHFSVLVAEADGAPVGFALYFPHFSTTRGRPGAYVQDIWTEPARRGAGLGVRLLAAVADRAAQDWGAAYLALGVHGHNAAAARFYQRLGFTAEDVQPMALTGGRFTALAGEAA